MLAGHGPRAASADDADKRLFSSCLRHSIPNHLMRFEPLQIGESRPVLGQRKPCKSSLSPRRQPATATAQERRCWQAEYRTQPIPQVEDQPLAVYTSGMARITKAQAQAAGEELGLPPIITLEEAARAVRMSPQTLRRKISEGHFKSSVKRGWPVLFWRDAFIIEVMKGPRR